jgi:hypothetical protein
VAGRAVSHIVYMIRKAHDGEVDLRSDQFARRVRGGRGWQLCWSAPDEEVHRFVNDLERAIGTYLYGHRMYEAMR